MYVHDGQEFKNKECNNEIETYERNVFYLMVKQKFLLVQRSEYVMYFSYETNMKQHMPIILTVLSREFD